MQREGDLILDLMNEKDGIDIHMIDWEKNNPTSNIELEKKLRRTPSTSQELIVYHKKDKF